MQIIFDDFRLNHRAHSYGEIRGIIADAQPMTDPITGRTTAAKYRMQNGLYSITQQVTHLGIKKPKVYAARPVASNLDIPVMYAVIMPTVDDRPERWMSYVIDITKDAFANLGPVNGAITELMHVNVNHPRRSPYPNGVIPQYDVKKLYTIRVDDTTGVPFVMRVWTSPDGVSTTAIKLINYTEDHATNTISYDDIEVGIWAGKSTEAVKQRFKTFHSIKAWERMVPGMVFDMTAPDFPLSNYDLVSGLYVD